MTAAPSVQVESPECPMCGEPMRLTQLAPSFAGVPELRTFQCNDCKFMMTMAHHEDGPHPRPPTHGDGPFEMPPTLVPRK